jgi:signal peptidase II
MKKNWVAGLALLTLMLVGCRADHVTKGWAAEQIKGAPITVIPDLVELRYAENRAIAFSMLKDVPENVRVPLIYALAGVALLSMSAVAWSRRKRGLWGLLPFSLVMAGAFGNLLDRVRNGYVIDFVHLHWRDAWSWPIFNLADSLIFVGMASLFWQFLSERKEGESEAPPAPPGAAPAS